MQRILDDILTWYFGLSVKSESSALDRTWRLEAAWNWQTWPFIVVFVVIVACMVALLRIHSRRRSTRLFAFLLASRFVTLFLLLLIVLQVHFKTRVFARPKLIVMVDSSGSMSLEDNYAKREQRKLNSAGIAQPSEPRLEIVKSLLDFSKMDWLKQIRQVYDLQLFTFDSELHIAATGLPDSLDAEVSDTKTLAKIRATGTSTDFQTSFDGLLRQFSDQSPVGVILFSDGRPTKHSAAGMTPVANKFKRAQLPVYSVGIGVPSSSVDVAIEETRLEPVGFAGDNHPLTLIISTNQPVDVPVRITATNLNTDQVVSEYLIEKLSDSESSPVEIVIPDLEAESNEYRIEVTGVAGETNLQNNRASVRIWGYAAKLKVLLIEQQPRWEFRHLKTALERDRHLIVSTFLLEGDAGYAVEDRTALAQLPMSLNEFDAIVIGDIDFGLLPDRTDAALEEFVNGQGGLLLLSGKRSLESVDATSAISDLHPAILRPSAEMGQRLRVEAHNTSEGEAQQIFSLETEKLESQSLYLYPPEFDLSVKPAALSLFEGIAPQSPTHSLPLILSMRYGGGVVTQHLIDDIWRWRVIDNGKVFRKFWRQSIRNLCRQKLIEQLPQVDFFTNQESYQTSDQIKLTLIDRENLYRDSDSIPAIWRLDTQLLGELILERSGSESNKFAATIKAPATGEHHVTITPTTNLNSAPEVRFTVSEENTETDYYPLDSEFLQKVSEGTGGQLFFPWELDELPDSLPNARFPGTSRTLMIPIWNRWEIFTLLVCVLAFDWVFRRRNGLD